jgi:SAM-dependent methyltransferase
MVANEAPALPVAPSKHADPQVCPICGTPNPLNWLAAPDWFHGRTKKYQLLRCSSCSLVWLKDPPSPSEMGEHYGEAYDRAISTASKTSEHWFGRRDAVLHFKASGALLDLGCGSGGFLSAFKGPSWQLYGVEMSEYAAAIAHDRCGAQVFVGDVLDAPFQPNSFDAITCFNVFEHMYEPDAVLAQVAKWLKPGGVFYTMMPNIDSAATRIFRSYWYALELPRHLYHFSPATLKKLGENSGLTVVSIKTHRELYFETSVRYAVDDLLRKLGIPRKSVADSYPDNSSIPWRAVRKVFRVAAMPIINAAASFYGDGETITAVFTKNAASA